MWPFKPASPPPVPQKLREMLKEYPELIERLQESLNKVITDPVKSEPPFEVAIWRLEGALDSFFAEASKELQAAEASGDAEAIEKAKRKEFDMGYARANLWVPDLQAYFNDHQGGF
jgi:hypothetical protein